MKVVIALCVLALAGLSLVDTKPRSRRCIYVEGRCFRDCEEGTHSYTVGCGQKTPEPTCDEPNPVQERGSICDYSACYCNSPTVRDNVSGKCVLPSECKKA